MAGDWIKMRIDLQTHPKIVRILSATESDKFRVIGGLHSIWSIFDTHSEDGVLNGYTVESLDHVIGWSGFSEAVESVGWLKEIPEGLVMPEFTEHNGKSGKRRAEDQKRKRESRKCPQSVRKVSESEVDKKLTRGEKRREDVNNTPIPPKGGSAKRFVPPSIEDWLKYANEIGFEKHDASRAYDHYVAVGWKVGKNPMKDWKAACRNCKGRAAPMPKPRQTSDFRGF